MNKLLPLLLVLIFSCKTAKNKTEKINLDQIASENLNNKFIRSDMGDYALFYTESKTPGVTTKNVLVLSILNGETLYGPTNLNADVKWHEEGILEIKEYVGVVENPYEKDKGPYYLNILTKEKSRESR